jgi:hypothetical protein
MNGMTKHFFIYVFERPDDPFAGLKHILRHSSRLDNEIHELRLSRENYNLINRIDYSRLRKRFRFLYYRRVFQELKQLVTTALDSCSKDDLAVIYFSDDGVWAEFWSQLRRSHPCAAPLIAVNVQHGWLKLEPASGIAVRKLLNRLTRTFFGSLAFGLGSLGGCGGGVFEIYLVYSPEAAEFVQKRTGDRAISCPSVIKHQLTQMFRQSRQEALAIGNPCSDVLMALQPPPFVGLRAGATVLDMMREWLPIARILQEEHHRCVVIRRHPGTPAEEFEAAFRVSGISAYAQPDSQVAVYAALAQSAVVFSYMSTVLFESHALGLTPVSVCGGLYNDNLETLPHVRFDMRRDLREQVRSILDLAAEAPLNRADSSSHFDWESILLEQVQSRFPNQVAALPHGARA